MKLSNNNIVKTNRKESFWFHTIRSINYFSFRYWWLLILLFLTFLITFFFLCKHNDEKSSNRNPIALIDSLNNAINNCCGMNIPKPPRQHNPSPQPPQVNCRVFFSGALVGGYPVDQNVSVVYQLDSYSEFVGAGDYPDNTIAFPKSVRTSFDGIAIDANTRLIIYSKKNFQGQVLLDVTGPLIINNVMYKNNSNLNHVNTDVYPSNLQETYPPSKRIWSASQMHDWSYGSCKITCGN
jgi:hypothetical protein